MSILKGIITGVKAIFGAGEDGTGNVMKVATGIGGFIDEQKFTEEEKAKYNAELIPVFQQYMDSTVRENTQRSITRRSLAIWIIRTWIFLLAASIIASALNANELAKYIYEIATLSTMDYLVLGVGAFFFGSHIIRQTNFSNPKG